MSIRLYFACTRIGRDMLCIKMEDNARHVKGMFKKSSPTLSSSMSTRMGKFYLYMYMCILNTSIPRNQDAQHSINEHKTKKECECKLS